MRERVLAYAVGLVLTGLVAWPLLRDPHEDSYPFSTYPMFSHRRERPWSSHVVAVSEEGQRNALPPAIVANDEVMQAAVAVKRAVALGPIGAMRLCQSVIKRLHAEENYGHVTSVEVVSEQYDPVRFFADDNPAPLQRVVHARCRPDGKPLSVVSQR